MLRVYIADLEASGVHGIWEAFGARGKHAVKGLSERRMGSLNRWRL